MLYIENKPDVNGNVAENGNGGLKEIITSVFYKKNIIVTREDWLVNGKQNYKKPEKECQGRPHRLSEAERLRLVNELNQLAFGESQLTEEDVMAIEHMQYEAEETEAQLQEEYAQAHRGAGNAGEEDYEASDLCFYGPVPIDASEKEDAEFVKKNLYGKSSEEKVYLNAQDEFQHTMHIPEEPAEPNLEFRVINPKKRSA